MPKKLNIATMEVTTSPALQDYKDGVNARMAKHFTEQVIWLKAHHVVRVLVDYDGSGDSGQFNDLSLFDKNDQPVPYQPELFEALAEMLEEITNEYDWWNNDGGYGTIKWDLDANTFKWDHSQRISNTEDYTAGEECLEAKLPL